MTAAQDDGVTRRTPWQVGCFWMRRAVMLEIWGYLSIFRFAFRRPRVPSGATAFTYHQPVMPLLIVFIVVSAIELVVVDVLVRRWPPVRITMLALGIWGLVWMFGMLFGFLTRPHAVGPAGIRLRSGAELDLPLSWEQVEAVGRHKRVSQDTQPQVTVDEHGSRTVHLHVQHETNTAITLRGPVELRLPRGAVTASRIELFADDPDAFVAAAREHLRERAR
jgi:hypothetical protein